MEYANIRNRTRHPVRIIDVTGRVTAEFPTDGSPIRVKITTLPSDLVDGLPIVRHRMDGSPDDDVIEASEEGRCIVLVSRKVLDALTDQRAIDVAVAPDTGIFSKKVDEDGRIVGTNRWITRAAA